LRHIDVGVLADDAGLAARMVHGSSGVIERGVVTEV